MALTKLQSERLEELQSTPLGIVLEIYLPNLSDDAIWKLGRWAELMNDNSPKLSEWLHSVAVEEIYRRSEDTPIEVKVPRIPTTWSNAELADALVASYALMRSNRLRDLDDFCKQLTIVITMLASDRLKTMETT